MRLLFTIVLIGFASLVSGQDPKQNYVDSLELKLKNIRSLEIEQVNSETKSQKIEILCLLARHYDGIDSIKTFDFAFEALDLSKKTTLKQDWRMSILRLEGHICT